MFSSKAVNIVLMGRLSKWFDFPEEQWLTAIEESVPPKFLEMNKKAFHLDGKRKLSEDEKTGGGNASAGGRNVYSSVFFCWMNRWRRKAHRNPTAKTITKNFV